jgi:N-glycosylase/DNA lyase
MDVIHDKYTYIAVSKEHHLWFPKRDHINSIEKWLETLSDDKGIQLYDPFDQLLIWMEYMQSKMKSEKHYVFTILMAYIKSRYSTGFWWWPSTRYQYSTTIYIVSNQENFGHLEGYMFHASLRK